MGKLVVISGPSGVGKSTVTRELIEREPRLERSRSATTREERFDDETNKQYDYLSKQEFEEKIEEGAFLEWARVYDQYYGTLASEVERIRADDRVPILEIDIQGAEQIRSSGRDHISIFLEPPSFGELKKRLKKRGTNRSEELEQRLEVAKEELKEIPKYDFRIVNDELDSVVDRTLEIIRMHVPLIADR